VTDEPDAVYMIHVTKLVYFCPQNGKVCLENVKTEGIVRSLNN